MFEFPEGIGPVECVNVEHEEVVLIPRWVDCRRVTFKYGLGDEFIGVLKTLNMLGLDSTEPLRVKGVEVAPRDVVAAALPDPATLGDRMTGRTCAGTLVTGTGKDGEPRAIYLYHVADNEETMARDGAQAVVWQTAVNPVVAIELLAAGVWRAPACSAPRPSTPCRSSTCSPSTARRTRSRSATPRILGAALGKARMPTKKEDLPGTLKRSPAKAQRTYAETLDAAEEQYDSGRARTAPPGRRSSTRSRRSATTGRPRTRRARPTRSPPSAARPPATGRSDGRRRRRQGNTKEELYERAKQAGVKGRSNMNKQELAQAVARKQD